MSNVDFELKVIKPYVKAVHQLQSEITSLRVGFGTTYSIVYYK